MIKADEFLATIFADIQPGEHVMVSQQVPKRDGSGSFFVNHLTTSRSWRQWLKSETDRAWYFCVSSVDGELNEKASMVGRGRSNLRRMYCIVLDDIGTKADFPPVSPSWKIQTSPGNYQWGYLLEATEKFGLGEALLNHLHRKGWGDGGAGGSYRLMRIPGSTNLKPGRGNFRSVVEYFDPIVWTIEELCADFDKEPADLLREFGDAGGSSGPDRVGGDLPVGGDITDPMLVWLGDQKFITNDDGSSWVSIICPWASQHTSGENTAGYSPLGRGQGKWSQTRAFKCLHEHCQGRALQDLVKWGLKRGGPAVAGFDPLPWLQARYLYCETGQKVFDTIQRGAGGVWQWDLADWKLRYPGTMRVGDKQVSITAAFINDENTRRVVDTIYRPVTRDRDTGVVNDFGQSRVNTYVPPNWPETDQAPGVFLEHIEYLIPKLSERSVFLDWLACKIQKPHKRSYAVVMATPGTQGTGRSWLKEFISNMLQGHVETASLPQLVGLGTAAEQTYNDWMVGNLFLVIEETKEASMTRSEFYTAYDTFKDRVDTRVIKRQRINPKYGRTYYATIYFNALIFSNHLDAIAFPKEDRRIFAIENPDTIMSYEYYEALSAALDGDEPARAYWWLMRRDISGYDRIYPPKTALWHSMVSSSMAPSDAILEWIIENHPAEVVTREGLRGLIVLGAHHLDFERQKKEPADVCKILWRKLKSLAPDNPKHGRRFTLDGKQIEVRALARRDYWLNADVSELAEAVSVNNVVSIGVKLGVKG